MVRVTHYFIMREPEYILQARFVDVYSKDPPNSSLVGRILLEGQEGPGWHHRTGW